MLFRFIYIKVVIKLQFQSSTLINSRYKEEKNTIKYKKKELRAFTIIPTIRSIISVSINVF